LREFNPKMFRPCFCFTDSRGHSIDMRLFGDDECLSSSNSEEHNYDTEDGRE